jgi:hypothetical protein
MIIKIWFFYNKIDEEFQDYDDNYVLKYNMAVLFSNLNRPRKSFLVLKDAILNAGRSISDFIFFKSCFMVIELGLKFGELETVLKVFNYLEEKHFEKFFSNSDEVRIL